MVDTKRKRLFCFGFGYVARQLANALAPMGFEIAGTTRDYDEKDMLREQGVDAYVFDEGTSLINPDMVLDGTTHVLLSIPPKGTGDTAFNLHASDFPYIETLQWAGYLSASSVYGNHNGGWVDEATEINPGSIRGSRRASAEKDWMRLWYDHAVPMHIFRLAGIYGEGRSALDTVQAGFAKRIDKEDQVFSRVHVDDIVQTLIASMNDPKPGSIYNVADDTPTPSHEVIAYACQLLGIEPPPLQAWTDVDLSPMAMSFYKENKRLRNDRIKEDLGIQLKYPNYRDGLKAIFASYGGTTFSDS